MSFLENYCSIKLSKVHQQEKRKKIGVSVPASILWVIVRRKEPKMLEEKVKCYIIKYKCLYLLAMLFNLKICRQG